MSQRTNVLQVELPSGNEIAIVRRRFCARPMQGPRVALVAGVRGDAPEGMLVAHRVAAALEAVESALRGTVDVYPCLNPLAAHHGTRLWPFFDVDMDRLFPGRPDGHPPDRAADAMTLDLAGADNIIELRGAHPGFRELHIASVRQRDPQAADLARRTGVALVWARAPGPKATGSFANQHPGTIALSGGSGGRLSPGAGEALTAVVLNLLRALGVLEGAAVDAPLAPLATESQVCRIRTVGGGLFLPSASLGDSLVGGAALGVVLDPSTGEALETVRAPSDGRLVALLEQPVVFPGSVVARMVVA